MKKSKLILSITTIGTLSSIVPMVSLTSCNKATLESIKVEVTNADITQNLPIYYTLHKSDIKVTGKYSNGSEGIITNWISEDFGTNDSITFDKEGTYTVTIKVGTQFKETLTFKILAAIPYYASHAVMTLGFGSNFTTGQKLEIYSGTVKLEAKNFEFTPDNDIKDSITINAETGLISVKSNATTGTYGYVTVTPRVPSAFNADIKCLVTISNNIYTMQSSYYDDWNQTCSIGINGVGESGMLSLPEIVTKEGKTYTVTSMVRGGDNISEVEYLNIPNTITSIPAGLFDDPSYKLREIRYCGTKEEWLNNVYPWTGSRWAGYLPMGVYCYDELYLFDYRQVSQYFEQKEYGGQKYDVLAMPKAVGNPLNRQAYAVKFKYSQLPNTKTPSKFNNLYFKDSSWGSIGSISVNQVYLDGKLLDTDNTKNNWYSYSGGVITIESRDSSFELTKDSEVVVHFTTPIFAQNSIHFAACEAE